MTSTADDLDLLLSLDTDRVPETPPSSPSPNVPTLPRRRTLPSNPYTIDADGPKAPLPAADMSVFRDVVKDFLDDDDMTIPASTTPKPKKPNPQKITLENLSGFRIKNQLIPHEELSNKLADVRFVRLSTIRSLAKENDLSGSYVTVGVLVEKGDMRLTSTRKEYCIWRMACVDENTVSVFLFGSAYSRDCDANVGEVYALFNLGHRQEAGGRSYSGFSLSAKWADQILKLGTSADYRRCSGKKKDGVVCTKFVNKRKGAYCKDHTTNTSSHSYSTMRSELKGGNIRMMNNLSQGVHMFDPTAGSSFSSFTPKSSQRVTVLSVDGLKKALSKSDRVTTNPHSQGVKCLTRMTDSVEPKVLSKESAKPNPPMRYSLKRPTEVTNVVPKNVVKEKHPEAKRTKTNQPSAKMIHLEIISSDEEADDLSLRKYFS